MLSRIASRGLCAMIAGAAALFAASSAWAVDTTATITSGNSSLFYDLNASTANNGWDVDGADQFGGAPSGQQGFWVSVNGGNIESLGSLQLVSHLATANTLTAVYAPIGTASPYPYTISYTTILAGGASGSGASAIGTTVSLTNNQSSALSVTLYDFVNATVSDDVSNTLSASGSPVNSFVQTDPLGGVFSYSVSPNPDHYQVANDGSILTALQAGTPFNLSDNFTTPLFGNDEFATQFDETVGAGLTNQISITETLNNVGSAVPVPTAATSSLAALVVLGAVGLIAKKRKLIA